MSYLGIDCGSVSVKAVIIDNGDIIGRVYLKNQGLLTTIKEALSRLPQVKIKGVGVTGSGKEVVAAITDADYVDSEILAHVAGCQREYPKVRTIIDIGGEDSKLMMIRDDVLDDFRMNQICGAGTGAMIEAIATRLGVSIEDVGRLALESRNPARLAAKCGIFAQSAVVNELNKGRSVPDILLGVCQALVGNYLLLAKGRKLESPIVFEGATAQNQGLVKCFEEWLGISVLVPDNCAYMGAIGIAELARHNTNGAKFKGIQSLIESELKADVSFCEDCENRCELLSIYRDSLLVGRYGSRCGKHDLS